MPPQLPARRQVRAASESSATDALEVEGMILSDTPEINRSRLSRSQGRRMLISLVFRLDRNAERLLIPSPAFRPETPPQPVGMNKETRKGKSKTGLKDK